MSRKPSNRQTITIRLKPSVIEALKRWAVENGASASQVIEILLMQRLGMETIQHKIACGGTGEN